MCRLAQAKLRPSSNADVQAADDGDQRVCTVLLFDKAAAMVPIAEDLRWLLPWSGGLAVCVA